MLTYSLVSACVVLVAMGAWREFAWRRRLRRIARPLAAPPVELPELAAGVGAELATLASGIEGNAQLLCEAIASGEATEPHADHLCGAVRRLRTLSETIQLAVGPVDVHVQPTCIDDVAAGVQHELVSAGAGRFQVVVDLASSVPEVHTDPRALRQALLLLAEVVFGREPGADKVTLRTRNALDEAAHAVVVEMIAEVAEHVSAGTLADPRLLLAHKAAANVLTALGAEWALQVIPGVEATAYIALPAADPEAEPPAVPEAPALPELHAFGGALVLESNPDVRHMVGKELERWGRQVFPCADAMAARALWHATPDRFELLVVEAHGGHAEGEALVVEALAKQPGTRAILLGRPELPALALALASPGAHVTSVSPPFGMMELRDALAHVGIDNSRVAS